jgi:4-amino-4-deoxy-L-arabinose transferase-like glycosyltransferase
MVDGLFWRKPVFWQRLAVGLLIPALFSHLGYLPLDADSDEPRRALVALEMLLSGRWFSPTLNGAAFLNKPPLYNWLIAWSFRLFGNYDPFALRFPMAVSLLGFGGTVWWFVRRYMTGPRGGSVAFAAAFMLLTNARILLYDSLYGLIDITFSWAVYTAFMLVFHLDRRRQYALLFAATYALTALGFLMKGLPALVFQGLTLLAWFGLTRRWRLLLSWAHAGGIGVFTAMVGGFYAVYFSRNAIPALAVFGTLFRESAKRTVIEYGFGEMLLHLLTFPLECLYHFAPWPLLLLLLIRRGAGAWFVNPFREEAAATDQLSDKRAFIFFNALVFAVNFPVYWSSPQVYARYLFMFLPLLFTVLSWAYYEKTDPIHWSRRWIDGVLLALAVVVTLGCALPLFLADTRSVPGVVWKSGLMGAGLGLLVWQLWRQPQHRLLLMLVFLVTVRSGFNWLVLPPRVAHRQQYKDTSEQAARLTLNARGKPQPLYIWGNTFDLDGASDVNSFHLEARRGRVLIRNDTAIISTPAQPVYYLADSARLDSARRLGLHYRTVGHMLLFNERPTQLIQFVKPAQKQKNHE